MTTINVKFFASLRELAGTDQLQIQAVTIAQLRQQLQAVLPAEAMQGLLAENVRMALNQVLIEDDSTRLADGDEVAFLPPVTGG